MPPHDQSNIINIPNDKARESAMKKLVAGHREEMLKEQRAQWLRAVDLVNNKAAKIKRLEEELRGLEDEFLWAQEESLSKNAKIIRKKMLEKIKELRQLEKDREWWIQEKHRIADVLTEIFCWK